MPEYEFRNLVEDMTATGVRARTPVSEIKKHAGGFVFKETHKFARIRAELENK